MTHSINDNPSVKQYLSAMQVACLLNAAVCRTRRCAPTKGSHPVNDQFSGVSTPQSRKLVEMIQSTSLTITDLVCNTSKTSSFGKERSALELCHAALGIDTHGGPIFLCGYLRAIEVHEVCNHYESALYLLDIIEQQYEGVKALSPWGKGADAQNLPPFVARYDVHRIFSQNFLAPVLTLKAPMHSNIQVGAKSTGSGNVLELNTAERKSLIEACRVETLNDTEREAISAWINKIKDRLKFKVIKYPNRANEM